MPYATFRRQLRATFAAASVAALGFAGVVVVTSDASAAADPSTAVRVNQVAYTPGAPKQATLVNSSGSPVAWALRNADGATVASGQTSVKGADSMSGDTVHIIDFSTYDTIGHGYVLNAGGADSYPFDISADAVKKLRYDALAFFYHQRSGTPILSQHVGSAYARPAAHLNVSPNQGDNNVPCRVSCGYTQDLRGGWYDAGDHGKYLPNGGISSWQLQNEYERAVTVTGADAAALGDSTLAIPERGNGIPDILDEARWEVEFLLKMQVPDGRTDAGMARHKISDENWTGLPQRPELDAQRRVSSAVTTAATLNLAAVAAQTARIWKNLDPAFSATALAAARKAYTAAKANPRRYADANDSNGSGTYTDNNVTDEFYWAAAELYVTTGEAAFRADLTSSSLYRGASFNTQGFDWWWVGGLGDATLAMVPNGLPSAEVAAIRQAIAGFADRMLNLMASEGYPAPTPAYNWGSNGNIANNANAMALAYDFTGQQKYRDGVFQTLSYLFGRNPLNRSYVAGYGENPVQNVHHRFWARSLDSSLPIAPPGSVAGGANRDLQDPVAAAQLAGCAQQRCHIDDIQAYSVNEVALNWNSSVAWLANWAAEKAGTGSPSPTPTPSQSSSASPSASPSGGPAVACHVSYTANNWATGFTASVTVMNNGTTAWNGWTLKFTFANGQTVTQAWSGTVTQSGSQVTATNASWNGSVSSGASASFGFNGTHTGANTNPTAFSVNGAACT
jgi:endoglucanase